MKSLLLLALGLARTVVLGARIEAERIVVSVRPYKRGNAAAPYAAGPATSTTWRTAGPPGCGGRWTWRARPATWSTRPAGALPGARRAHRGRPRARHGARFTRDFEDWVAWLAVAHRLGGLRARRVECMAWAACAGASTPSSEAARGASRFDGVRRIGIDETSYKRGHKYVTVVVDDDRGCLIWAHEGTGKDVAQPVPRRAHARAQARHEVVTADGARWIRQLVKRRRPEREVGYGPLHVVLWMNDVLDAVRCEEWNAARAAARAARPRPEGKRGRLPSELPPEEVRALEEEAASIKGSRRSAKNPEDLTDGQRARLEALKKRAGSRLVRAWSSRRTCGPLPAADGSEAAELLDDWMHRAAYCKIAKVVAVEKKVRRRRDDIIAAVELGISNGRVEAINKIKVAVRNGLRLPNTDNLVALLMLRCGDCQPQLPGRPVKARKKGVKGAKSVAA